MKKIFFTLMIALALTGCKKEKADMPPVTATEKKLIEYKNLLDPGDYRKYSYDGQQRLFKSENLNYFYDFEYTPGKMIITTSKKSDGSLVNSEEFLLDAMGRVTHTILKNSLGVVTKNMYMIYDAEGYLKTVKTVYPDGEELELRLTTSGGNVIREDQYRNAVLETVIKYYYDPVVKNNLYNSMVMHTWGIKGLYGKDYTNLCNGAKSYDTTNTIVNEWTGSYVLHTDGYLSKMTFHYPMTGQKREFEYLYNK